jgi:protein RecA
MGKSSTDDIASILGGNDKTATVSVFLDTGYAPLNKAISGEDANGLPLGRMIEIFGPPSSGKTAIATQAMVSAQRAGGIAAFFDHERSFDINLAVMMGLDTKKNWVYKTPESFEKSITMACQLAEAVRSKKMIPVNAPIFCVFDSLAAMVPQSKLEKDIDDYNMNDNTALARSTAAVFPALAQRCERDRFTALFLNQARTKIGVMFGDPTSTPGGSAMEFYASLRIKLGKRQIVRGKGPTKVVLGMQIGAECVKNKINRPFQKATWNFMFKEDGTGFFDVSGSLIELLVARGVIATAGNPARVDWDGKKILVGALGKYIDDNKQQEKLLALYKGSTGTEVAPPVPDEDEEDDDTAEAV